MGTSVIRFIFETIRCSVSGKPEKDASFSVQDKRSDNSNRLYLNRQYFIKKL